VLALSSSPPFSSSFSLVLAFSLALADELVQASAQISKDYVKSL